MTGRKEIPLDDLKKKEKRIINRDVVIFSFFLFLSFIFWYLNALGKEIVAEVRYPVHYINLPKEKVIGEEQHAKLNLSLRGTGFSLLKLKLISNRTPVIIDLSKVKYKRVTGGNNINYYLITSGEIKNLTAKLISECEIISVKPDTLFFTINEIASKSIQVKPDIEVVE
ncbi:MAG TPA: hypothetical protein VMV77_06610 [Bacteroidales bacterium]|nr:hypothetical protein [Bacteroidales bacterium]